MHPRLRTVIIVALAPVVGIAAAVGLANESYVASALVLGVLLWVGAEWAGGPRPEAWVLAAILVGYIVGNRGFAQASPVASLPLLPAESAFLICVPAMLFRSVFRQAAFIRKDGLNLALGLWMLVGAARLPLDWREFGGIAVRDFAMVYYAGFFFIAQGLGGHAASVRLLGRAVTVAAVLLPPVAMAFLKVPDFFINTITLHGIPLIYHKYDLVATSLAAGFFWLWMRWEESRRWWWLAAAGVSLACIAPLPSPRAAMVAALVVTIFWILARRWRIAALQFATVAVGAAAVVPVLVFSTRDIRSTPLYSAYEHAISIADFEGRGAYVNDASGDPGGNNRFRLVWWRAVALETWDEAPVFGLGFGYDLSARFLADYDWLGNEDFNARSPHSMLFSTLGRMGIVGLALWLWVAACMAKRTIRAFRRTQFEAMGWWSVAWTLWVSACFGVVLEGPMGAVIFWTALGLANATTAAGEESEKEETTQDLLENSGETAATAKPALPSAAPGPEVVASP